MQMILVVLLLALVSGCSTLDTSQEVKKEVKPLGSNRNNIAPSFIEELPKGFTRLPKDKVQHNMSKIIFPKNFEKYERAKIRTYNGTGSNASVDYKYGGTYITFFVYPRAMGIPTPRDEFATVFKVAMHDKKEVVEHDATCTKISKKDNKRNLGTFIGAFSWRKLGHSLGGWVFLASGKDNYYKLRVTYPFNGKNIVNSKSVSAQFLLALIPEITTC